jgi:hypothetical protein
MHDSLKSLLRMGYQRCPDSREIFFAQGWQNGYALACSASALFLLEKEKVWVAQKENFLV